MIGNGKVYLIKDASDGPQLDIVAPEILTIRIGHKGRSVWINVDDVCRVRLQHVGQIKIKDEREGDSLPALPAEGPTEARQEHRAGGYRRYASEPKTTSTGFLKPPE